MSLYHIIDCHDASLYCAPHFLTIGCNVFHSLPLQFSPASYNDGKLEVVGLAGVMHMVRRDGLPVPIHSSIAVRTYVVVAVVWIRFSECVF